MISFKKRHHKHLMSTRVVTSLEQSVEKLAYKTYEANGIVKQKVGIH